MSAAVRILRVSQQIHSNMMFKEQPKEKQKESFEESDLTGSLQRPLLTSGEDNSYPDPDHLPTSGGKNKKNTHCAVKDHMIINIFQIIFKRKKERFRIIFS